MKTLEQVNEQINQLRVECNNTPGSNGFKSFNKEYSDLIIIRNFLETKPNPDFLQQQINALTEKINKIKADFNTWCINNRTGKKKLTMAVYLKERNADKTEDQILFLKKILE